MWNCTYFIINIFLDIQDVDGEFFNDEIATLFCGNREKFLYVHQTVWQRRLLMRYGNEIALLDATYRTTKYALPLYFLCVPTNVNYITVASFVLETEDRSSIMEAMYIIKKWNPNWKPQYFMSDYCDEEITALETVFPGMNRHYTFVTRKNSTLRCFLFIWYGFFFSVPVSFFCMSFSYISKDNLIDQTKMTFSFICFTLVMYMTRFIM